MQLAQEALGKDTHFSISLHTCSCALYVRKAVPNKMRLFFHPLPPPKGDGVRWSNSRKYAREKPCLHARTEELTRKGRKSENRLRYIDTHHTIFEPNMEIQQRSKNIMVTLTHNEKIMEKILLSLEYGTKKNQGETEDCICIWGYK